MKLTGQEIAKQVALGNIIISPFDEKRINPNSYNVRLDTKLLVYTSPLDLKRVPTTEELFIPEDGILLYPNKLYLGSTVEYTETKDYFPGISGRSSIGRYGINIHATAGFGDTGFCGNWTLEIFVVEPVRIYPNVEIGQLYFEPVIGDITPYSGKYQGSQGVFASKMHEDFNK